MKGESLHPATEGLDTVSLTAAFAQALGRKPDSLKADEAAFIAQVAADVGAEEAPDGSLADLLVDPCANPEEQLVEDRRGRRLRSVLAALPERDRQCVYLRAEGLRYREIAKTLDISLGAVAKSLTRAMTRLTNAVES